MPWCGDWGTAVGYWWIAPLFGLVFMGVMLFVCLRGFRSGCLGRSRRIPGERPELEREVEALKEEVRRLAQRTS